MKRMEGMILLAVLALASQLNVLALPLLTAG